MIKTLDLVPVLPELFVAVAGLALLMLGVFRKEDNTRPISVLVILVLAAAMVLVSSLGGERHLAFNGLFVADRFAGFAKGLRLCHYGDILHAKLLSEYPAIVDKVKVTLVTDAKEVEKRVGQPFKYAQVSSRAGEYSSLWDVFRVSIHKPM